MKVGNNTKLTVARAMAYKDAILAQGRGPIAFVAIPSDPNDLGIVAQLGVAVANEKGYYPIPIGWAQFNNLNSAQSNADDLNRLALEINLIEEAQIITSTMGGNSYYTSVDMPPSPKDKWQVIRYDSERIFGVRGTEFITERGEKDVQEE